MSKAGGGNLLGGKGGSIPSGFRPPLPPGTMPPAPPNNSWGPGMGFNIPGGGGMPSGVLQNFPKLQQMFGQATSGGGGGLPSVPPTPGNGGATDSTAHWPPKNIQDIFAIIQQLGSGGGGNIPGLPNGLQGILSKLGGL